MVRALRLNVSNVLFHSYLLRFFLAAAAICPLLAWATDGVEWKIKGALNFGTVMVAEDPSAELINRGNAAALGVAGEARPGRNADDGMLNYRKGDIVSSALKGWVEAQANYRNVGMVAQVRGWYDSALIHHAVSWGNYPNGLTPNVPLSDAGFSPRARFSGMTYGEVYAFGTFRIDEHPLSLKIGKQLIPWGLPDSTGGALSDINPVDFSGARRAGATPQEGRIPFSALFAQVNITPSVDVAAFVQLAFQENEAAGCGTYFSVGDFLTPGCDKIMVAPTADANDRDLIKSGAYLKRSKDHVPASKGKFGLGMTYKNASIASDFGLYYLRLDSRRPVLSGSKSTNSNPATPFIAGHPDNPLYFMEWPDAVQTYAINFITRLPDLTLSGELSYRPNDIFRTTASDFLNALNSATAPSLLRADVNALAPGADFSNYLRGKQVQLTLAGSRVFHSIAGASQTTLSAEAGLKYVPDLPDVTKVRFGRPDVFGLGPVNGACTATANATTCSNRGFVTRTAWGYRLRATMVYPDVFAGIKLTPSLAFSDDVAGWSADQTLSAGRHSARLGLQAEYRKDYFAEAAWAPVWGGDYNSNKHKSTLNFNLGMRF